MKQSALLSLAYLKIHWDTNRGIFLDNFIPFVIEALKVQEQKIISLDVLQENLFSIFRIRIPQSVLKALLFRIKKKGYVTLNNHVFSKSDEKLAESSFGPIQQEVERIFSALLFDFINFTNSNYGISISEKDAEDALISFISYNQVLIYQPENEQEGLIEDIPALSSEMKYIVANYIYLARKSKPEVFKYIDTVVQGYMLAQVLYLPNVHDTKKLFRKTKIFFDTPFIILALGYSGEHFKNPCQELLDLLYQCNAKLYCFEHTYEEIKGILTACSNHLGKYSDSPFGRTVHHLTSLGYTSSDVNLLISKLRKNIELLRIQIVPSPSYSNHQYVIAENELFEKLKDSMTKQVDESGEQRLLRDVASISAIYRIRKNNYSSDIENSGAVFVTTSYTLAKISNDHFYSSHDRLISPPCITDYILTNVLWLKIPNLAPDLPMKRVIADAFAAIQPGNSLINKWVREVDKLKKNHSISDEDYYFFRSSQEVIDTLMETTLGNHEVITEGTIPEIIAKSKEKFLREAEDKYQEELSEKDKQLANYEKLLISSNRERQLLYEKMESRAAQITYYLMQALKIIMILLVSFIGFITLPRIGQIDLPLALLVGIPDLVSYLILAILFFVTIYNLYFGETLVSFLRKIEVLLRKKITNLLMSLVF